MEGGAGSVCVVRELRRKNLKWRRVEESGGRLLRCGREGKIVQVQGIDSLDECAPGEW